MITEEEAKRIFAPSLKNECPECEAPVGELCSTPGVWVHLERLKLVQT